MHQGSRIHECDITIRLMYCIGVGIVVVALILLVSLFKKLAWESMLNLFVPKIICNWMRFYVNLLLSAL